MDTVLIDHACNEKYMYSIEFYILLLLLVLTYIGALRLNYIVIGALTCNVLCIDSAAKNL